MLVSAPEVDNGAWGGVIAQPDGKVVIGGKSAEPGLVRYTASGALDQTFGIARNGVAIATGGVSDLARQPDGKLVTVGFRSGRSDTDANFGIARFNRSGLPDMSFHGGEATTDIGGWDMAEAVALQPDGRIVVGGSTERLEDGITQSGDFALARYVGVPELPGAERDRQDPAGCEGEDRACKLPARTGRTQDFGQGRARAHRVPTARRQARICRTEARSTWL